MSGHRRGARLLPLAATASAIYALWLRPRLLTWGATSDEIGADYAGDDLIPAAESTSTLATTLPAPPEQVWPWLVQMGGDRGGWYSWDRLDHGGEPSADRIVPEWQHLEVGHRLAQGPDGQSWFTVEVLEPQRTLVLRSELALPSGGSFDIRSGPLPRAYVDGTWGFHLRPAPGGGTRLVVRTHGRGHPRGLTRPFDFFVGEPLHVFMQTRQFHNLRSRFAVEA
jgi:hypothetical protein